MQYYKKFDGSVWAFDDGVTDILESLVPMSSFEVEAHLNALPAQPLLKRFTSLEFLDLFTEAEQLAVVAAAMASPQVKLWYDRVLAASYISLADARTGQGLAALATAGLITQERLIEVTSEMS